MRDNWVNDNSDTIILDKSAKKYLDRLKNDLKVCHDNADIKCAKAQQSYVDQYNLKSTPKSFEIGDQVLVMLPDSSNKLRARWQGPSVIHFKHSKDSYSVAMPGGAVRRLHADLLRPVKLPIHGVGIIFDDDEEGFGEIISCDSAPLSKQGECTVLSLEGIESLDLSYLSVAQQLDLRNLLREYRLIFDDKPRMCNVYSLVILTIEFEPDSRLTYSLMAIYRPEEGVTPIFEKCGGHAL